MTLVCDSTQAQAPGDTPRSESEQAHAATAYSESRVPPGQCPRSPLRDVMVRLAPTAAPRAYVRAWSGGGFTSTRGGFEEFGLSRSGSQPETNV